MSIHRFFRVSALLALAWPVVSGAQPFSIDPIWRGPRLVVAQPAESPVTLRALRVRAQVSGLTAQTEVELTFHNPNARSLEGELQFPLQPGQTVTGMAMQVGGQLREAVPVDKAQGEASFEAITRANVDPALLSHTEGDNYKLRVYPLPAGGDKVVVLRYVETLERGLYRLPLAYAQSVPVVVAQVVVTGASRPVATLRGSPLPAFVPVAGGHRLDAELRDLATRGALEVSFTPDPAGNLATERRDGHSFFLAEAAVPMQRAPRRLPRIVSLVWDSSGSAAERDRGRELALLGAYFAKARDVEVRLTVLRDAAEPVRRFAVVGGDWQALRAALEAAVCDGATNLGAYVRDPEAGEVLLFTDGLANFGASGFPSVEVPVYAVSSASRQDATRLRAIGEASGGRFIDLLGEAPVLAAARLLETSTRIVSIESDGATQLIAEHRSELDGHLRIAGELTETRAEVRVVLAQPDGRRQTVRLAIDDGRGAGTLAAQAWARMKIAALEADPDSHRAELRRLGSRFGVVTRETSLVILDRAADYARYDITPPPELASEVAGLRQQGQRQARADASAQLERVVVSFQAKQAWWRRDFPRTRGPVATEAKPGNLMRGEASLDALAPSAAAVRSQTFSSPAPTMAPVQVSGMAPPPAALRTKSATADASLSPSAIIRLRPVPADAPYAARMRSAEAEQVYAIYLDERATYPQSTAFYLDVAEVLFERRQDALAIRVLSNLAEMDLENRQVLRLLGARLVQAGRSDLAVPILRRVLLLAPGEPQSQRDLGLALAANGQSQAAIEALYEVGRRPWERFPEIELIALAELNAVVANSVAPLDTSSMDPRLLQNLPLDLRATLSWDADNTDIDLWVTDPNGERAYYGHPLTRQGGSMSRDITSGYGPEEFSLRHALPGKYTITAQFYGQRQQLLASATTVQLTLATGFGTSQQQARTITLKLKDPKDQVLVGEIDVGSR